MATELTPSEQNTFLAESICLLTKQLTVTRHDLGRNGFSTPPPHHVKLMRDKTDRQAYAICAILSGLSKEEILFVLDTVENALNKAIDIAPVNFPLSQKSK